MAHVTLLVTLVAMAAAGVLSFYLARMITEARRARINFRATVEGLSVRTYRAAEADRERARGSDEVAEAARMLAQQETDTMDALAFERKLRKAIAAAPPPGPATEPTSAVRKQ